MNRERLNEIHRFQAEEVGIDATNVQNVYPESTPDWLDGRLDMYSGYLVGNQGPGWIDFRFFTQGNLLAILFGLAMPAESREIMSLFRLHRDELIGEMPLKITYPAMTGREWRLLTGSVPQECTLVMSQRRQLAGPDLAFRGAPSCGARTQLVRARAAPHAAAGGRARNRSLDLKCF